MSVHTLSTATKEHSSNKVPNPSSQDALSVEQTLPANVVNIRTARKAQEKAQQELMDYLMWSMKHDMDPHRLYDDPIEVYRAELKRVVGIA